MIKTAIKNIVWILVLDLILFPLGVALWLFHGFHLVHVVLGFGYLYGFFMVFETANILLKHIRIVNDQEAEQAFLEAYYHDAEEEEEEGEPMSPEMEQAMDEVFELKK
jgi:hypothetical protein